MSFNTASAPEMLPRQGKIVGRNVIQHGITARYAPFQGEVIGSNVIQGSIRTGYVTLQYEITGRNIIQCGIGARYDSRQCQVACHDIIKYGVQFLQILAFQSRLFAVIVIEEKGYRPHRPQTAVDNGLAGKVYPVGLNRGIGYDIPPAYPAL